MNNYVQKIVSLILVVLITLLVLSECKIIVFSLVIKDVLSFITIVLMIFSSTSVICCSKSALNKFINYLILLTVIVGITVVIINKELNVVVYVSLLLSVVYALIDMLYNKKFSS